MSGAFKALVSRSGVGVVEDFARKHREDCQLRLAEIQNSGKKENGKKLVAVSRRG